MVFQSYALYPHMNVRENMGFPLRLAKVDKATIDAKVTDAARILDLTEHLDRKPANLSGGQRQRVAMGRAIVRDPKAFLMDEPLSNLDAKLRVQMRTQISRLQRRLDTADAHLDVVGQSAARRSLPSRLLQIGHDDDPAGAGADHIGGTRQRGGIASPTQSRRQAADCGLDGAAIRRRFDQRIRGLVECDEREGVC